MLGSQRVKGITAVDKSAREGQKVQKSLIVSPLSGRDSLWDVVRVDLGIGTGTGGQGRQDERIERSACTRQGLGCVPFRQPPMQVLRSLVLHPPQIRHRGRFGTLGERSNTCWYKVMPWFTRSGYLSLHLLSALTLDGPYNLGHRPPQTDHQ
jgi:hypothetical protein